MQIATRSHLATFQAQVRMLAMQIGLRPAARACGLDENRVLQWSKRGKWGINGVSQALVGARPESSNVISPIEAVGNIVQHYGDRAKIGATIAGAKALEHLADCSGKALTDRDTAIAGDSWTKAVDRAAGWTAARQQGTSVQVAVVVPPSEAERAAMDATDAKLDEITALLKAKRATLPVERS